MRTGLREAAKNPDITITWVHYWTDLVAEHHVVLKGWPHGPIPTSDPISNLTVAKLQELLLLWENKTLRFERISDAECAALLLQHATNVAECTAAPEPQRKVRWDKGTQRPLRLNPLTRGKKRRGDIKTPATIDDPIEDWDEEEVGSSSRIASAPVCVSRFPIPLKMVKLAP